MLTENGLHLDSDAVNEVLAKADLLTIGFTLFPERLLIDTRANASAGPFIAIVEPVATVQDRYLWLGKHRGEFGAPEAFSFFVWPQTVRHLVETDTLAPMRARLAAAAPEAAARLDEVLAELVEREREAIKDAVRGDDGWVAVWERQPAR